MSSKRPESPTPPTYIVCPQYSTSSPSLTSAEAQILHRSYSTEDIIRSTISPPPSPNSVVIPFKSFPQFPPPPPPSSLTSPLLMPLPPPCSPSLSSSPQALSQEDGDRLSCSSFSVLNCPPSPPPPPPYTPMQIARMNAPPPPPARPFSPSRFQPLVVTINWSKMASPSIPRPTSQQRAIHFLD